MSVAFFSKENKLLYRVPVFYYVTIDVKPAHLDVNNEVKPEPMDYETERHS